MVESCAAGGLFGKGPLFSDAHWNLMRLAECLFQFCYGISKYFPCRTCLNFNLVWQHPQKDYNPCPVKCTCSICHMHCTEACMILHPLETVLRRAWSSYHLAFDCCRSDLNKHIEKLILEDIAKEGKKPNQSQALVAVGGGRSGVSSLYPPVGERQHRGYHSCK